MKYIFLFLIVSVVSVFTLSALETPEVTVQNQRFSTGWFTSDKINLQDAQKNDNKAYLQFDFSVNTKKTDKEAIIVMHVIIPKKFHANFENASKAVLDPRSGNNSRFAFYILQEKGLRGNVKIELDTSYMTEGEKAPVEIWFEYYKLPADALKTAIKWGAPAGISIAAGLITFAATKNAQAASIAAAGTLCILGGASYIYFEKLTLPKLDKILNSSRRWELDSSYLKFTMETTI